MRFKPNVTVAAIIADGDKYLLVEEKSNGRLVINQPAGHLEKDESLIEAVCREVIEETAYARASDWFNTLHSRLVGPYLTRFGSDEQCERFLPRCASGECILAIAMTEPDAGSDLAGIRATAVEKDDHWLLSGSKTFISNSGIDD